MQSPPAIYKEYLIAPSMDRLVRAWNIRTGKLVWTFNLVPQPGEPGHETWENDAWKTTGGVNVWGHITVDTALGIAYVPTAPPSPDYVGVNRPGDTLYGTSLVALDANTGKLKWFHQLVHHDLWDFDSAAAPTLVDVVQRASGFRLSFTWARWDSCSSSTAARASRFLAWKSARCRRARCPARNRRRLSHFP